MSLPNHSGAMESMTHWLEKETFSSGKPNYSCSTEPFTIERRANRLFGATFIVLRRDNDLFFSQKWCDIFHSFNNYIYTYVCMFAVFFSCMIYIDSITMHVSYSIKTPCTTTRSLHTTFGFMFSLPKTIMAGQPTPIEGTPMKNKALIRPY